MRIRRQDAEDNEYFELMDMCLSFLRIMAMSIELLMLIRRFSSSKASKRRLRNPHLFLPLLGGFR